MKRINHVFDLIVSKENLYRAARRAARGKRFNASVADFNFRLEEEIERLHQELTTSIYRPGPYRAFTIFEPKKRLISVAPFRDRVVHHAVHDILEPLIDPSFIFDSYACRTNKGTHKALGRAEKFLRANRFCLHMDVKKNFPSVDHGILKILLRGRIEDGRLLQLLDWIIDSTNGGQMDKCGLPIGNLTSQFFANLVLNELDRFVKHTLRRKYYLRYMDDFLVFGNDKEDLGKIKSLVREFLKGHLSLRMHEGKSQIEDTRRGVKFLGFRLYIDHRRLISANVRRFRKRLARFAGLWEAGELTAEEMLRSVDGWVAHSKGANSKRLRKGLMDKVIAQNKKMGDLLCKAFT